MAEAKKTTKLIVDLRAMDVQQISEKIAELKKQLVEHHRANHAGELPSSAVIGKTRKGIAQAEQVRSEKQRLATKETK